MALKDLSGKTVYELEPGDFEELFCQRCKDFYRCDKNDSDIEVCKALIDSGIWDKSYHKD